MTWHAGNVEPFIEVLFFPLRVGWAGHECGSDQVSLEAIARHLRASGIWVDSTEATRAADERAFKDALESTGDGWKVNYWDYQARAYFHPFVRRFLWNPNLVRRFVRGQRHILERVTIQLQHESLGKNPKNIELDCLRCELFVFQPDMVILMLEVKAQQPLDRAETLLVLDQLRRLYPPYFDLRIGTWNSGHCPVSVILQFEGRPKVEGRFSDRTEQPCVAYCEQMSRPETYPISEHWRYLLEPFSFKKDGDAKYTVQQFGDDRLPILSFAAVDRIVAPGSSRPAVEHGDWMRLCFADEPGNDHVPYYTAGPDDISRFESRFCNDRFWRFPPDSTDSPSRILNSGYAFCWVGSNDDTGYFMNQANGAIATFRHVYVRMGLVAHFQRAALLSASDRMTSLVSRDALTEDIQLPDRREVRAIYERFLEFTQNFWFPEITPQEQGRELFAQWGRELGITNLYADVRQQLQDLSQWRELKTTGDITRWGGFFAALGLAIGSLSFYAGLMGMNTFDVEPKAQLGIADWFVFHPTNILLTAVMVGVAIATAAFLPWRKISKALRDPGRSQ